jgi:hypothetical protein
MERRKQNVTAKIMDISTDAIYEELSLENEFANALEDAKQMAVYLDTEPVILFSQKRYPIYSRGNKK